MTSQLPKLLGIVLFASVTSITGFGIDVGDPIFQQDVSGRGRVEVLYEKYDRDVTIDFGDITLVGPGGSVAVEGGNVTDGADLDLFILRGSLLASDTIALYGDLGLLDDPDASDTALLLGAGIRVLAYQGKTVRLSVFGAGHYVPAYDVESNDFDPDLGRIESEGEIDGFEFSGGAIVSSIFALDKKTSFMPYGGLAISVFRGNVDVTDNLPDIGARAEADADIEEDDLIQLILGTSLIFNENWSLRVEGRVVGDSSISGGLGVVF